MKMRMVIEVEAPLKQRPDGRWECWNVGERCIGYCLSSQMIDLMASGHPIEGLAWGDIWSKPEHHTLASVLGRCPWITEEKWERDRARRIEHKALFHFDGHETEEQALACYQRFLKDWGMSEMDTL